MTTKIAGFAVLGLIALAPLGVSLAQTTPVAGANSFTEGQARDHIEKAGYTGVTALTKTPDGMWTGTATKGGKSATVSVDFKGAVTAK